MIAARLRRLANQDPRAPAFIARDREISRVELMRAGANARRKLSEAGLRPGGFVMVSLPVSFEAVAIFVACAELGLIFLPVNVAWRKTELSWLIAQAPPSIVIVAREDVERWVDAGVDAGRMRFADEIAAWGADLTDEDALRDDLPEWPPGQVVASIVSSGTMGRPKIGLWTAARILDMGAAVAATCAIGPGSRLLATVPFHHGHGIANGFTTPLLSGATVVLLERFDPHEAARAIERHSVGHLISSPVIFSAMVDANVPGSALCSLRVCLSSSAPLAPSVAEKWKALCGVPIRQAYGSSEAGMVAIQLEESEDRECVGRPLPGTAIRILSGDEEQPCGEAGEIAVRGPGTVTRYLDGADVPFWSGFVRTGDLGRMDAEGRLYVSGRLRPWINAGGVKVDPIEVQRAIGEMPGVRECRVEAESGPGGMEIVACTIAPEPGINLTRADVIRHCRTQLAEFKIPRVIRFVTAIATDLTGKAPYAGARPFPSRDA